VDKLLDLLNQRVSIGIGIDHMVSMLVSISKDKKMKFNDLPRYPCGMIPSSTRGTPGRPSVRIGRPVVCNHYDRRYPWRAVKPATGYLWGIARPVGVYGQSPIRGKHSSDRTGLAMIGGIWCPIGVTADSGARPLQR